MTKSPSHISKRTGSRRSGCPRRIFAKEWKREFSKERKFNEDHSYVEKKRIEYDVDGDDIRNFLADFEKSIPSCVVEEVATFCRHASLKDIDSAADEEVGVGARAWMDDRSRYHAENCACSDDQDPKDRGCARRYESRLCAAQLYGLLRQPRFGVEGIPNADRRLIYINDPDPAYILALAETASYHQIPALIDAIWQHIAFQISIRIQIPVRGYSIFQLEFQVPYFALRPLPSPKDGSQRVPNGKLRRRWIDISFLEAQSPYPGDEQRYGLAETQFSLLICGSDDWRWVAYSFEDTYFDEIEEEEDLYDGCDPYERFFIDPIASDDHTDANKPIWNPRAYYLAICKARSAQVLLEWQNIRAKVERNIKRHEEQKNQSPLLQSSEAEGGRVERIKTMFDWILNMIELLCQLQNLLSKTNQAWASFSDCNGDIRCFSGLGSSKISSDRVRWTLLAIDENFRRLVGIEQDFLRWEKQCKKLAKTIKLCLTRESNEAVQESNKVAVQRIEMAQKSHEVAEKNHGMAQKSHEATKQNIEIARHNISTAELTASINCSIALAAVFLALPDARLPFARNGMGIIGAIIVFSFMIRLSFAVIGILLRPSLWTEKLPGWIEYAWTLKLRLPQNKGRKTGIINEDGLELPTVETERTLVNGT
ncbi:hypothetical protein K469DRAFT_126254 [Zopfia rhizophila CBS 207.26]|uniref:Uncharacterized protein n=1 Tax=Zopfia rhizophila CBS 207.26 TaxID=1314779 RepID=A0A6A6EUB4_9PEZI|nr:hypothetical protein K469DRAFT_126254 [Zopfia rhizophila CBS 207.26]